MQEFDLTSPKSGRTYTVQFDKEPTDRELQEMVGILDAEYGPRAIGTVASGIVRGAAGVVPAAVEGAGYLLGSEGMVNTGQQMQEGLEEALPKGLEYQDSFFIGKAPEAVGQALAMLATGGVGSAVGKALGGAKAIGMGAEGAVLGLAGLQGAAKGGQQAEQYGMTGVNAYGRILAGGVTEIATEKLLFGLGTETAAARRLMGDTLEVGVPGALKSIGTEGVEEAVAQTAGNLATNVGISIEGDPMMDAQRPGVFEGAGEAALLGMVGGTVFAGVNALTGGDRFVYDDKGILVAAIPKGSPFTVEQVKAMNATQFTAAAEIGAIKVAQTKAGAAAQIVRQTAQGNAPVNPVTNPTNQQAAAAAPNTQTAAAVSAIDQLQNLGKEDETGPEWMSATGIVKGAQNRLFKLQSKRDGSRETRMPDGTVIPAEFPQRLTALENKELQDLEKALAGEDPDVNALAGMYGLKVKSVKQGASASASAAPAPSAVADTQTRRQVNPETGVEDIELEDVQDLLVQTEPVAPIPTQVPTPPQPAVQTKRTTATNVIRTDSGAEYIEGTNSKGTATRRWVKTSSGQKVGDVFDGGMAVEVITDDNQSTDGTPDDYIKRTVVWILGERYVAIKTEDMTYDEAVAKRDRLLEEQKIGSELGIRVEVPDIPSWIKPPTPAPAPQPFTIEGTQSGLVTRPEADVRADLLTGLKTQPPARQPVPTPDTESGLLTRPEADVRADLRTGLSVAPATTQTPTPTTRDEEVQQAQGQRQEEVRPQVAPEVMPEVPPITQTEDEVLTETTTGAFKSRRKVTKAGVARVEAAKQRLRDIIINDDLVGRDRADAIENGRNLIAFLDAHADTRKPLDTGFEFGDEVAYTGEDAPEGFRSFIYLEGSKAGASGVARTPQARAADVEASAAQRKKEQAAFKRIRDSGQSDQMPAPKSPKQEQSQKPLTQGVSQPPFVTPGQTIKLYRSGDPVGDVENLGGTFFATDEEIARTHDWDKDGGDTESSRGGVVEYDYTIKNPLNLNNVPDARVLASELVKRHTEYGDLNRLSEAELVEQFGVTSVQQLIDSTAERLSNEASLDGLYDGQYDFDIVGSLAAIGVNYDAIVLDENTGQPGDASEKRTTPNILILGGREGDVQPAAGETGDAGVARDSSKPEQMTPDEFRASSNKPWNLSAEDESSYLSRGGAVSVGSTNQRLGSGRDVGSFRGHQVRGETSWNSNDLTGRFVVEDGNNIVASIKMNRDGTVEHLAVSPQYRGLGMSNALLDAAEQFGGVDLINTKDKSELGSIAMHRWAISKAIAGDESVSAEAVDTYGITLPQGYVKQGELYVFQPTVTTATETQKLDFFSTTLQEARGEAVEALREAMNSGRGRFKGRNITLLVTPSSRDDVMLQVTRVSNEGEPQGHQDIIDEQDFNDELKDQDNLDVVLEHVRPDIGQARTLGAFGIPKFRKPVSFNYRLRLRDVGPGTAPAGFISSEGRDVSYDRPLTRQELYDFEMSPVGATSLSDQPTAGTPQRDPSKPERLKYLESREVNAWGGTSLSDAEDAELAEIRGQLPPTPRDPSKPEQMTPGEWSAKRPPSDAQEMRAAEMLFAAAEKKGFVEGGTETPRLRPKEADAALKKTGYSHLDFKTGLAGGARLRDGVGAYSGQLLLTREPSRGEMGHRSLLLDSISSNAPVSAEAVDTYGIKLPEGYARQGDLYVYQPEATPPAQEPTVKESLTVAEPQITPERALQSLRDTVDRNPGNPQPLLRELRETPEPLVRQTAQLLAEEGYDVTPDAGIRRVKDQIIAALTSEVGQEPGPRTASQIIREAENEVKERGIQTDDEVVFKQEGKNMAGVVTDILPGGVVVIQLPDGTTTRAPQSSVRPQQGLYALGKHGLNAALAEQDGQAVSIGITAQDVQQAARSLKSDIPQGEGIWTGTAQQFLDELGQDPLWANETRQISQGIAAEGGYNTRAGRGFILLDQAMVYQGDQARATQNGTTPQVESAKRLIRHEVGGHGGWTTLTEDQIAEFLQIARNVIPDSDLDALVGDGYPFQDWRTDEQQFQEAAEEWFSQNLGRMTELPKTGPLAAFTDWLKKVWRWLTGNKGDPSLDAIRNLWKQIVQNNAEMRMGRPWYSLAGDGTKASYIGEKAIENMPEERKQFMRDSLETAQAMAAAGKSSEEIRAVTGWFPGKYDGKMRWEIPDEGAAFYTRELLELDSRAPTLLGDLLSHDALFEAYPAAREIEVLAHPSFDNNGGGFDPNRNRITVGRSGGDEAQTLSTLLHEVQHWIQEQEGFTRGSNPSQFSDYREAAQRRFDYHRDILDALADAVALRYYIKAGFEGLGDAKRRFTEDYGKEPHAEAGQWAKFYTDDEIERAFNNSQERVEQARQTLRKGGPEDQYRKTAGEIEARDIQARQRLTPAQRAATAPYSSENIAPEDAIVMFGGSGSQASMARRSVAQTRQDQEFLDAVERGDSGNDNLIQPLRDAPESERNAVVDGWTQRNPVAAERLQRTVNESAKAAGYVKVFHTTPKKYPSRPVKAGDWVSEDTKNGEDYQIEYNGENWKSDTHVSKAFVFSNALEDVQTGFANGQTLIIGRMGNEGVVDTTGVQPYQIKSADPVTFDESGNVILPSQRFNPESNDIRFSRINPDKIDQLRELATLPATPYELSRARQIKKEVASLFDPTTAAQIMEVPEYATTQVDPLEQKGRAIVEMFDSIEELHQFVMNSNAMKEAGIQYDTPLGQAVILTAMKHAASAAARARSSVVNSRMGAIEQDFKSLWDQSGSAFGTLGSVRGHLIRRMGMHEMVVQAAVGIQKQQQDVVIDTLLPVDKLVQDIQEISDEADQQAGEDLTEDLSDELDADLEMDDLDRNVATAESIITEAADRLGDVPAPIEETERKINQVRELYYRHVRQQMDENQFSQEAEAIGLDATLSGRLWNVGNLERESRDTLRQARSQVRREEIAESRASQLIYGVEERLRQGSKDLEQRGPTKDTINKAFRDQVSKPVSFDDFRIRLRALGVGPVIAARMYRTAEREALDLARIEAQKKAEPMRRQDSRDLVRLLESLKDKMVGKVSWRDLMIADATDGMDRQRQIFDRVQKHTAFQNLSPQEQITLTRELHKAWLRKKRTVMEKEIERVGIRKFIPKQEVTDLIADTRKGLSITEFEDRLRNITDPRKFKKLIKDMRRLYEGVRKGTMDDQQLSKELGQVKDLSTANIRRIVNSTPRLIQALNLGTFDRKAFRDAISEQFGIRVLNPQEMQELRDLAAKVNDVPKGLPQDQLLNEIIKKIQTITYASRAEIVNDFWVASVLSGARTQFDTLANILNSFRKVLQLSAWVSIWKGDPKMGMAGITRFFEVLPGVTEEAIYHIFSGDQSMLNSFGAETMQFLNEGKQSQFMAAARAEKLWKDGGMKAVPAFFIVAVRRLMSAFDHLSATAAREAAIPLAMTLNRKLYDQAMIPGKLEYQAKEQQAIEMLLDGRKPATMKERVEVRKFARQLLEQSLPPSLMDEVEGFGLESSYQNDPTGIGGGFYHAVLMVHRGMIKRAEEMRAQGQEVQDSDLPDMLKTADKWARTLIYTLSYGARAMTGFQFARFAGNKLNELLGFVPVIGAVARLGMERNKTETQKASIIMDNLVGTALNIFGVIAVYGMMGDDDDEERGWRMEGGWNNLTIDKQRQLRAAGKSPYSLGVKVGGEWRNFSYIQWPTSGAFATVGNMMDRKRYTPDVFDQDVMASMIFKSAASGALAIGDLSALSQITQLIGVRQGSGRDPIAGLGDWINNFAAGYVGGFIPRVLKDADYMNDPRHNKPEFWYDLWLQNVPVYRRGVGRPYLDALGEQVELDRQPWSRAYSQKESTPAIQALSELTAAGVFLSSANPENRFTGSSEDRRQLTETEQTKYLDAYFPKLKSYLVVNKRLLLSMPVEEAQKKMSQDLTKMKAEAEDRAVYGRRF